MPAKSRASPKKSNDPCAKLKRKLKERDAELKEAREQQAETAHILPRLIASITGSSRLKGAAIIAIHDGRIATNSGRSAN